MNILPETPRIDFLARSAELRTVIGDSGKGYEILVIVNFTNGGKEYAVVIPADLAADLGSSLLVRGIAARGELEAYLSTGQVPEQ